MPKLPQVSGDQLIKLLQSLGYVVLRQKGSHVSLRKMTKAGAHNLTVPRHYVLTKGTLNDIITKAGLWNGLYKDQIVKML